MNGQLMPKEREFLHQAVLEMRPMIALEVGTWKGGGSTWQILTGLEKNGMGVLHTCETEKDFFDESVKLYHEKTRINLYYKKSSEVIESMISTNTVPDFIFFDGPEDEQTALVDFNTLNPFLKSGTVFLMHDWDAPSIKAKLMRPYLENLSRWRILSVLTAPDSVGLVKAIKL